MILLTDADERVIAMGALLYDAEPQAASDVAELINHVHEAVAAGTMAQLLLEGHVAARLEGGILHFRMLNEAERRLMCQARDLAEAEGVGEESDQ